MPANLEPLVIRLAEEWDELIDLCDGLTDEEWATPTELPGWSVKDCVSHIVGTELSLLGQPMPDVPVAHLAHVGDNPIAAAIESWVEARRPIPGAEVLSELRGVSIRRVAALRRVTPEEWDEVQPTLLGMLSLRAFMEIRVFDCWMHEQDIRRALGRPGHLEGEVVEVALGRITAVLGMIVGKRAGAPEGAAVVVEIVGASARSIPVVVRDGRAHVVAAVPEAPTATIRLGLDALAALSGGRWDADEAMSRGDVELQGDADLGRRVVQHLRFTP